MRLAAWASLKMECADRLCQGQALPQEPLSLSMHIYGERQGPAGVGVEGTGRQTDTAGSSEAH